MNPPAANAPASSPAPFPAPQVSRHPVSEKGAARSSTLARAIDGRGRERDRGVRCSILRVARNDPPDSMAIQQYPLQAPQVLCPTSPGGQCARAGVPILIHYFGIFCDDGWREHGGMAGERIRGRRAAGRGPAGGGSRATDSNTWCWFHS